MAALAGDVRLRLRPQAEGRAAALYGNAQATWLLSSILRRLGVTLPASGMGGVTIPFDRPTLERMIDVLNRTAHDDQAGAGLREASGRTARTLRRLRVDAESAGFESVIYVEHAGGEVARTRRNTAHERWHQAFNQLEYIPTIKALPFTPVWPKMARRVSQLYGPVSDQTLLNEAAAMVSAGQYELLELNTEAEQRMAEQWLRSVVAVIVAHHSPARLQHFIQTSLRVRKAIDHVRTTAGELYPGGHLRGGSGTLQAGTGTPGGVRPAARGADEPAFVPATGSGGRGAPPRRSKEAGFISNPFARRNPVSRLRDFGDAALARFDPQLTADRTLEALQTAWQKGNLPWGRLRDVARGLRLTRVSQALGARQAAFVNDTASQVTALTQAFDELQALAAQGRRGTLAWDQARQRFTSARLRLANRISRINDYTSVVGYQTAILKASLLTAPHILENNVLSQLADVLPHELSKLIPPVPQWLLKKYAGLDVTTPGFSLSASIAAEDLAAARR